MRLPFTDGLMVTTHFDGEMAALADRHYPRQKPGTRQFTPPARKLILRDAAGLVLFAWAWSLFRLDQQKGYCCTIFRNEGLRLSSEIVLEAERFAVAKWGARRAFTFIDPKEVRSPNPGYCFKKAGWRYCGVSQERGKHILEKELR
jgi:hypothetical protein